MALVQWLQSELQKALDRQGESGLVVWYDPGGTLAALAERAAPPRARLLPFAGSYLALRFALEQEDPRLTGRWILYIPDVPPSPSWLRDYELLGERLELDLAELLRRRGLPLTPRFTALLRERPQNARDLAAHWEQVLGRRNLTESTVVEALLALAFGLPAWQWEEALPRFLTGTAWQPRLAERGLWEAWRQEVAEAFGWEDVPPEEPALRSRARAAVLLADLTTHLPALAPRFPFLPADPQRRREAAHLARMWRQRTDLLDAYIAAARAVEEEYGLPSRLAPEEPLRDAETVPCIDHLWLEEIRSAVAPDGSRFPEKAGQIAEIADRRKGLFWARQDSSLRQTWEALALAAHLLQGCLRAGEESRKCAQLEDFIARYTESWWRLDLQALQLAALAEKLAPDDRRRFAQPAWRAYGDWLDQANRRFAETVAREGWRPTQPAFWSRVGHPRSRTAILLVDALRYDLAQLLAERTGGAVRWEKEFLTACLPTLTEVGMSALLPGAANSLALAVEGEQMRTYLGETPVSGRAERVAYLEAYLGRASRVISLEDAFQTDWRDVQLAFVFSQEVDRLGTFTAELHPAGLLNMVDRLAGVVQFLVEQGFEQFFVVADHGFLFLPPGVEPTAIKAPAAHLRGRRFAVGGSAEGTLSLTASQQGLRGDLSLIFPQGLAVFALQGPIGAFLHGGLSLQEAVVPLIRGQAAVLAAKVEVSMEVPTTLTSRIALIRVRVIKARELFARDRRIVVEIGEARSEPILLGLQQPEQTIRFSWLDEFTEPPPRVTVRLLDVDTGQVLEEKQVPVQLLI
ncbi:MAG: PglZ domain-containing protein [Anaerolineae bacterium]|nr:PglZ domain-containing protein [Anaerolineae bacterium]